jgi:hypothetical protein
MELMKVNLQLFGEDEVEETQELLEQEETTETEIQAETGESEEISETKEDRVPLNRFLEEKKRRKELERKLREHEEKTLTNENRERVDKIRDLVREKGYDDGVADLMSDMFNELSKAMPKVDRVEQEILEDIQDLAEENPDVLRHKKEIVEKVKKYRKVDPDFGVEEALNLIKPSKIRLNELKTDIEQKNAIARRSVETKKIPASTSSAPKDKYPLDEDDKKALEGLQKAMPNSGWTTEKYYKQRYGNK